MPDKVLMREHYLFLRKNLPASRKQIASLSLLQQLTDDLSAFSNILSFSSFKEEIDMTLLNHYLAITGRLCLPYMEGTRLKIFQVKDLARDIEISPFGLLQPRPDCQEIPASQLSIILVPALAFDTKGYRLGYGKGYYDRFLCQFPSIPTWGIGFKEQLVSGSLPKASHDVPVQQLFLF